MWSRKLRPEDEIMALYENRRLNGKGTWSYDNLKFDDNRAEQARYSHLFCTTSWFWGGDEL